MRKRQLLKALKAHREKAEQRFNELESQIEQRDEENKKARIEQFRLQGEYQVISSLIRECSPERAGLPPFKVGGVPSPPTGETDG